MAAVSTNWSLVLVVAIIFCFNAGVKAGKGTITNFTINANQSQNIQVNSGVNILITCRATYNVSTPIVHISKIDPNNKTWPISENEDLDMVPSNWEVAATTAGLPANTVEYVVTIPNSQVGDTGNYTCSISGSATKLISVDVISEPTTAMITLNGQQLPSMQYNSVQVMLNQTYSIACTISGGNPNPTATLNSSKGAIPNGQTSNYWNATFESITGSYSRSTTLTVSSFMFDASMLGKPVTCSGGLKNSNVVRTSFTPTSDSVVPQFTCDDKVIFPQGQVDLVITCQVFAPNLTSASVRWMNGSSVNTINGTLGQTVTWTTDPRYTLLVNTATPGSQSYAMVLTIMRARDISDLTKNQYQFVAINSKGKGDHVITVQSTGYVGGATQASLSAVSFLVTLLIAAAAAALMM